MPGFNIRDDQAPTNKNNKIESRRKHRWRFQTGFLDQGEWIYLEKAARPAFTLETPEMHHDQEVAYFAGKQTFEEITLEFYDVIGDVDLTKRLYDWIAGGPGVQASGGAAVTNLNNADVNTPGQYKTDIVLQITDGQGEVLDQWRLYGAWPKSCNWGDLDYSSTDIQRVTAVLRYDRAIKEQDGSAPGGF